MFPIHPARTWAGRAVPALSLVAASVLFLGGCGYEIQVSQPGTATPGPLHVHVIGGGTATPASALAPDVAEIIRQYLGTPIPVAAAPAVAPAAPVAQVTAAPTATQVAAALPAPTAAAVHYDAVAAAPAEPPASRPVQPSDAPLSTSAIALPPASSLSGGASAVGIGSTAAPAPTAVPAAAPAPAAAPSLPAPAAPLTPIATSVVHANQTGMHLLAGNDSFVYLGGAMPVGQALGALSGMYSVAYIVPPGEGQSLTYIPGTGPGPLIMSGSVVNIVMNRSVTVDLPGAGN